MVKHQLAIYVHTYVANTRSIDFKYVPLVGIYVQGFKVFRPYGGMALHITHTAICLS